MKKILTTLALVVAAMTAFAGPRSAADALRVAQKFISTSPAMKSVANSQLTLSSAITAKAKVRTGVSNEKAPAYYIVNLESDKGFVVVSGDDRFIPVLGYSASGHIAEGEQLPDGLSYWLNFLTEEMDAAIANGYADVPAMAQHRAGVSNGSVEPLLTTKWGQEQPFNNLIPNYATGCVATGMAQVMKYWNYPEKGTGTHTNYFFPNSSADFASTTYDWANMLDEYGTGFESKQEVDAVSTLMYQLGVATDMRWASPKDGSGTPNIYSANALINYFGYNKYLYSENRDCLSLGAWKALIISQLRSGHPLCYAGMTGENGGAGHFFVLDGYDANTGLFHFNWGWYGRFDGYFNITSLEPGAIEEAGALTGSYNYHQEMLIDVQPKEVYNPTARFDAAEVKPRLDKFSGTQLVMQTVRLGHSTPNFAGTIGLALYKQDGTFHSYVPAEGNFPGALPLGSSYTDLCEFLINIKEVPYGTYNVCLAVARNELPGKVFPVRAKYGNPIYYTMEWRCDTIPEERDGQTVNVIYKTSTFKANPVNDYVITDLEAPSVVNETEPATAYYNVPASFLLHVKNTGTTEFYDEVGICISANVFDSEKQYITTPLRLAPGEEKTVMVNGTVLRKPGKYNIVGICTVEGAYINLTNSAPITVKNTEDVPASIEQLPSANADAATYTLTGVRVNSTSTLPRGIYVKGGKKVIVK